MRLNNKKKHSTRKIKINKTEDIKNIKFNKYENTKVARNFKYIKMPYVNTELLESKFLLSPLKNIKTNKESIDTEQSLFQEFNDIEKIEKENNLSPKKDFYTYVNYAWMKKQNIVMDYKNYYFIKLDNFRFVQIP